MLFIVKFYFKNYKFHHYCRVYNFYIEKKHGLLAAASYALGFTIFLECTGTIIEKLT